MSTKFEKLVAKHELIKRRADSTYKKAEAIKKLSDKELEKILDEPDEEEIPHE